MNNVAMLIVFIVILIVGIFGTIWHGKVTERHGTYEDYLLSAFLSYPMVIVGLFGIIAAIYLINCT